MYEWQVYNAKGEFKSANYALQHIVKENSSLPVHNKGATLRILIWCCLSNLKESDGLALYVYLVEICK